MSLKITPVGEDKFRIDIDMEESVWFSRNEGRVFFILPKGMTRPIVISTLIDLEFEEKEDPITLKNVVGFTYSTFTPKPS